MGASTGTLSEAARAVLEAIEALKKQYTLDTNRFVIAGFSLGGSGTYHQLEMKPDYWAAAVPCSAGGDSTKIELIAKTPIWHHHGANDNDGAALKRMSRALETHGYPVLRVTSTQVVNSPASWSSEIKKGTKPQDIIFKNSTPSYDSLNRAIESGARYIFLMFNGGDHESARLNANHNPLVAKWAFSKVRGGGSTTVSFVPIASKSTETRIRQNSTILTFGRPASSWFPTGRIFSLLGQTETDQNAIRSVGVKVLKTHVP
jgi:poly(3-hydroxybutyrate) depolymerase